MRMRSLAALKLGAQRGHFQHGFGRMPALIALAATSAGQRLLHRLAREHTEGTWHTRAERDLLNSAGSLGAHIVVVIGLATNHSAKARDALEASGLRRVACRKRQLEGAWHVEHLHI